MNTYEMTTHHDPPSNRLRETARRSAHLCYLWRLGRHMFDLPVRQMIDIPFIAALSRVSSHTMLSGRRLRNAWEAVHTINRDGIQGDIAECGVWSGGCIALMVLAHQRNGSTPRTFHLFDSFEGLPQPSRHDTDVASAFLQARPELELDQGAQSDHLKATGACAGASENNVHEYLTRRLGIRQKWLQFHSGWFQDTVPAVARNMKPLAILRLDGDLFESTRICLEHLYDHVVEGGFVIIDDYGTFAGCRRAVHDFFHHRGIRVRFERVDNTGVYFRKNEAPVDSTQRAAA